MTGERLKSLGERPRGLRAAGAFVCRIARAVDAWADEAAATPPLPHQVAQVNNGIGGIDNDNSAETQAAISRMLQTPEFALAVQAVGDVPIPEEGFADYKVFQTAVAEQYARLLEEQP
jgi:hypothetical protein